MPAVELTTNVKPDDPKAFILDLSKLVADLVGSQISLTEIIFNHNELLSFGGTFEPAFFLKMTALQITPEANTTFSASLSKFLKEKLGVENKRGYIVFENPGKENIGFLDSTVAALGM